MPFTPYHLGPAPLLGLLLFDYLGFPTFVAANIIVDLEPFFILALGLHLPLHGFFHSLLDGTIAAPLLAYVMVSMAKPPNPLLSLLHLEQGQDSKKVFAAALFGIYLHILLDARLYADMRPFYPFQANPILSSGISTGFEVYAFCMISAAAGVVLYFVKRLRANSHGRIREK